MKNFKLLLLAAALLAPLPAIAQTAESAPNGESIKAEVPYCMNAAGFSVPCVGVRVSASSGNVANGSAAATLAAAVGQVNYLSGFEVTAGGATAGLCVNFTVTGLLGGTRTYAYCAPAGVLVMGQPLIVFFNPPLPASAANIAIVGTLPALGAGNTNAAVNLSGFSLNR